MFIYRKIKHQFQSIFSNIKMPSKFWYLINWFTLERLQFNFQNYGGDGLVNKIWLENEKSKYFVNRRFFFSASNESLSGILLPFWNCINMYSWNYCEGPAHLKKYQLLALFWSLFQAKFFKIGQVCSLNVTANSPRTYGVQFSMANRGS